MRKTPTQLPSFLDLRTQFEYEPESGRLQYRSKFSKKRAASSEAGTIVEKHNICYRHVRVQYPLGKGRNILAHRVVWKLMTTQEPPEVIDHIDGNGLNNMWDNLRDGSGCVNERNMRMSARNTSGFCGVVFTKGRWEARVGLDGRQLNLGAYETKQEAAQVARDFRLQNGYTERHGLTKSNS